MVTKCAQFVLIWVTMFVSILFGCIWVEWFSLCTVHMQGISLNGDSSWKRRWMQARFEHIICVCSTVTTMPSSIVRSTVMSETWSISYCPFSKDIKISSDSATYFWGGDTFLQDVMIFLWIFGSFVFIVPEIYINANISLGFSVNR